MLISPEVRNAIHVGDRILEINGLPVGTLLEDEVGVRVLPCASIQQGVKSMKVTQEWCSSALWLRRAAFATAAHF